MLNSPVLTLNSGMIPIDICNVKEAIVLQILDKAEAVKVDDQQHIRSQYLTLPLPRVIMLFNFHRIPRKKVVYSRLNIIYRDDMRCQYCGKRFKMDELTVDHVIPLSRWHSMSTHHRPESPNSWENQVCACKRCNTIKGNKLIRECGFSLLRKPVEPKYMPYLIISRDKADRYGWLEFLNYNVRVVEAIDTGPSF
ncbi:MAG: HNH endonuclease [Spirochaetota bacterium]|nr:MAG: HNH endonuclease [Spirochaetota bacterium]